MKPWTEENRIKKIQEIISDDKNIEEGYGVKIKIKDKMVPLKAYKIPLECLIYNPYNGRIASRVSTYEKEYRELNPEDEKDAELIEQFLWESESGKNQNTMEDLKTYGQNVAGVVTLNGMIADGNRRASILNRILREFEKKPNDFKTDDISKYKYFIAAVVTEKLDKKEMLELELSVQLAEDKVSYNAIEKYLKCDQLKEAGFSIAEIQKMMKFEKIKDVEESLGAKALMDEYLKYIGCIGLYTRLDKTEDPFLGLYRTISKMQSGKFGKEFDWCPTDMNLHELKIASFNFIRANIGVEKEYRYVTGARSDSFIKSEKAWNTYIDVTRDYIEEINENEKNIDELKEENPNSNIESLLNARDKEWKCKVENKLKEGLGRSKDIIESNKEKDKPLYLLQKAMANLEAIDMNIDSFYSEEVRELINQINSNLWQLKKECEKGIKHGKN